MFPSLEPAQRAWRKSSRSGSNGCVEVLLDPTAVGIRDSKVTGGPEIFVSAAAWRGFVDQVRGGRFDLPPGDPAAADR